MNSTLYYFDLAAKSAKKTIDSHEGKTFFLYTVGVRKDQAVVGASNLVSDYPNRLVHSEARVARMLDYGATLFVVRMRTDMSLAMARPCEHCQKALQLKQVEKAFYTISDHEFGVWYPNKPDRYYYSERKLI